MARVKVDGAELPYQVTGTGPAVLLVHGTTGDASAYWRRLVPKLEPSFTVISYDQRGFGASLTPDARAEGHGRIDVGRLAEDADALLAALGIRTASVVGMSLGGLVAQQLAADRPDVIDRLVLVSTAPRVGARLQLMGRVLGAAARLDTGLLFDLNLLLSVSEGHLVQHAGSLASARDAFVAAPRPWFGSRLSEPVVWNGVDLAAIRCPALLVYGDEDAEMPLRYARELHDQLPDSRLHVITGAGHKCAEERPEEFAATLRAFLLEDR